MTDDRMIRQPCVPHNIPDLPCGSSMRARIGLMRVGFGPTNLPQELVVVRKHSVELSLCNLPKSARSVANIRVGGNEPRADRR